MENMAWGVNLPSAHQNVIALDYEIRILGMDESQSSFIVAVKTMRDYARATFGAWSAEGGAMLYGLRESRDFCEMIRTKARWGGVQGMTVTMPVGAECSRERATLALCGVLGTMGIGFVITAIKERVA
jgi:hypothetical protein